MNVYIWLDDERKMPAPPFEHGMVIHARNYQEALISIIGYDYDDNKIYVNFDHDLGEKKSGYDVAKFLVENEIKVKYRVHSMNPVGRANIEQLLDHYGYKRF